MLQWMGGSRRKVTTSRKSTHKRQKQYFEQRKRQQQQHTACLEGYVDEKPSCTLHCENNRSLDILSLVNVSTVAQEKKISRLNAKDDSEEDHFNLEHQNRHCLPAILTNESIPVDPSETNQVSVSGTSSSCGTEAEYSNKTLTNHAFYGVSISSPVHSEDLVKNGDKLDSFRLSNMHQISVIDLLGDGGANNTAEEESAHAQEPHVAFSVEGLGNVQTETPVHSPRIPGRTFPNGFSPPKESRRQPSTSEHLDYGFDDLGSQLEVRMQDIEFSVYESPIEEPFCTGDIMNVVGDPNHKFSNFRNFGNSSPFIWKGNPLESVFGNDEPIYNIRDGGRNILNGPNIFDDSVDDLGEHESLCKNWVDERNVGFNDYFHDKDLWMQDFNFKSWNLQKKRSSTNRTESFTTREPAVSHPKYQIAEDIPDLIISDVMWFSSVGIDDVVKDAVNGFVREDTGDSLSLLSEESCSSTAVRGDATKKS